MICSALILVGYIILVIISRFSTLMVSIVASGLSPLCSMPLLSLVPLCHEPSSGIHEPRYQELIALQTNFESIMESAGSGTNLALNMKKSEMAVRDLNTLVGSSFNS